MGLHAVLHQAWIHPRSCRESCSTSVTVMTNFSSPLRLVTVHWPTPPLRLRDGARRVHPVQRLGATVAVHQDGAVGLEHQGAGWPVADELTAVRRSPPNSGRRSGASHDLPWINAKVLRTNWAACGWRWKLVMLIAIGSGKRSRVVDLARVNSRRPSAPWIRPKPDSRCRPRAAPDPGVHDPGVHRHRTGAQTIGRLAHGLAGRPRRWPPTAHNSTRSNGRPPRRGRAPD